MLTICLTCTKCGNVFEATTSGALPPDTREKLGQTFDTLTPAERSERMSRVKGMP